MVHFGRGSGLFGTCFYGMVEVQGRDTLHCHLLLWLSGNYSPQQLHDRMCAEPSFKDQMFAWLEDIICCELPGMEKPVSHEDEQLRPV